MENNKVKKKENPKSMLIKEILTFVITAVFLFYFFLILINAYYNGIALLCLDGHCPQSYGFEAVKVELFIFFMCSIYFFPITILILYSVYYQFYFFRNYKKVKREYENEKNLENKLDI